MWNWEMVVLSKAQGSHDDVIKIWKTVTLFNILMHVSAPIVVWVKGSISNIRPAGIQVSTGALKSLKAQAVWGHVDGKISVLFHKSHKPGKSLVFQLYFLYFSTEISGKKQWIDREPGQVWHPAAKVGRDTRTVPAQEGFFQLVKSIQVSLTLRELISLQKSNSLV